jgi:hypothetical protein
VGSAPVSTITAALQKVERPRMATNYKDKGVDFDGEVAFWRPRWRCQQGYAAEFRSSSWEYRRFYQKADNSKRSTLRSHRSKRRREDQ